MKTTGHLDIGQDGPATVEQLDLFAVGIKCWHCNNDPGLKPGNSTLWNGFFDMDANMHVCFGCKKYHINWKATTEHKGLHAEFPVSIHNSNHVQKSKK